MSAAEPDLYDLLPKFDAGGDPAADFRTLAEWIEVAEWVLRTREFAEVGEVVVRNKTYSIRVNGREREAPHIHVNLGRECVVRVFLGAAPDDIRVVADGHEGFGGSVRNEATRRLITDYVKAHHGCLLQAWKEHGNPLHSPDGEMIVDCETHQRRPSLIPLAAMNGALSTPGLNAHLVEENEVIRRMAR